MASNSIGGTKTVAASLSKDRAGYTDVTLATRHRMQAVRGQDTAPELRVRCVLHAMGYRYRLHRKDLPGTPDIVLPRHRKIIFVHGCFWHGHEQCKRAKLPTKNAAMWQAKIDGNRVRDQRNIATLRALGWSVLVIWECEVHDPIRIVNCLQSFLSNR